MEIDLTNYEPWFLDLIEGRLDAAGIQKVRAFVEANPGLAEELREMETMMGNLLVLPPALNYPDRENLRMPSDEEEQMLTVETVIFEGKEGLRKKIHYTEEDELLIAALAEGDLHGAEEERARQLTVEIPALAEAYRIMQACKLVPADIHFPEKDALRRTTSARVIPFAKVFAYAAAIFGIGFFVFQMRTSEATLAGQRSPQLRPMTTPAQELTPDHKTEGDRIIEPRRTPSVIVPEATDRRKEGHYDLVQDNGPVDPGGEALPDAPMALEEIDESLALGDTPDVQEEIQTVRVRTEGYQSVFEFAGNKAKRQIWGGDDYPEDRFVVALAERELDRRFGQSDSFIEVRKVNTADEKELKVRVGKFSYTRTR